MMTRRIGQVLIEEGAIRVPGESTGEIPGTRDAVFAHVRSDDAGRYRPLSGARTLPTGWRAPLGEDFDAEAAIETVYPLALVHQRQLAEGSLRVVSLEDVLVRQSGRYEGAGRLSPAGRERATRLLCGECVRRPVWAGAAVAPGEIPCPEPCSVLVAFCREAALWEARPPAGSPPDATAEWADLEAAGNELRERYLQEMAKADE